MSQSIVAIGGDLGSGKSTVARLVADQLGLKLYSTGGIQRTLAAELGVSSLELNRMAESDPSIDHRIDNRTIEVASKENHILFDSRLAWHLVPHSFKVFLTVDPGVGAQRIFSANRGPVEQYGSLERAAADLNSRRASENKRYAELYRVNPENLHNYDLCVDTSQVEPALVAEKLVEGFKEWQAEPFSAKAWLSPQCPFPTHPFNHPDAACSPTPTPNHALTPGPSRLLMAAEARRSRRRGETSHPTPGRRLVPPALGVRGLLSTHPSTPPPTHPFTLIRSGRYFFIYHGHHFVSEAIQAGTAFIEANVLIDEDDVISPGVRAGQFVERECTPDKVSSWEAAHQFHYLSYPPFLTP